MADPSYTRRVDIFATEEFDSNLMFLTDSTFKDFVKDDSVVKNVFDDEYSEMKKSTSRVQRSKIIKKLNNNFRFMGENFVELRATNTLVYPENLTDLQSVCLVCMILTFLTILMDYNMPIVIQGTWFDKIDRKTRYIICKLFAKHSAQVLILTTDKILNTGIDDDDDDSQSLYDALLVCNVLGDVLSPEMDDEKYT